MPQYRLTPEITQQICHFIRAGGYGHVAAEAAGIPRDVFRSWLELAHRQHPRPPRQYVEFAKEVCKAGGQARLTAEITVRDKDPKFWLCHGPGKELPGEPGWSAPVKAVEPEESSVDDILNSPEILAFKAEILEVLSPYPDARTATSDVLMRPPKKSAKKAPFSRKSS